MSIFVTWLTLIVDGELVEIFLFLEYKNTE